MKINLVCLSIVLSVALTDASGAGFNKAGRTVMQFVKIGIGARQTAMGEAAISVVRDVNSVFWNPAGISGIQSGEASFSYNQWFSGLNYLSAAAGYTLGDVGTFALSATSLDYGDIPEALVTVPSGSADTRTGGTFTGRDMMLGVTYSRQFMDRLSIGISAKYLHEKLWIYSSSAFAFDVGTFFDTGFRGIRFAMSFQNFGNSVKFLDFGQQQEGYDLPLVFRLGASIDLINPGDAFINAGNAHRFTLAVDAVNSNDYGDRYNIGAEYTLMAFSGFDLSFRGGYRFNYTEGKLSLGAGIEGVFSGLRLRFDYSYVSYEFLDSPNRMTLTVGF
jgi:Type IX secretion system protein PorV